VELKLFARAEDLPRIPGLALLRPLAEGPARTVRQVTTYFDTPDLDLARLGVALRLRRQGDRTLQTVKTLSRAGIGDAAAVAVRREWEWPVTGDQPDRGLLTQGELGGLLTADLLDRLVPAFTTDIERTLVNLRPGPAALIELAVDCGSLTARPLTGPRTQPVAEVELELKAGRIADLFTLAAALHRCTPLRLSTRSKADAGFSLLTGRGPVAIRAKSLGLSPFSTVAESFRHIARNGLSQLLDNEDAVLAASDPEALRELAAGVRRLDAAFSLFKDTVKSPRGIGLRHELRALGHPLETARAWDRVGMRVVAPLLHQPGQARHLAAAVAGTRRQARLEAQALIRSPRWTGWLLEFGAWLEDGAWADGPVFTDAMRTLAPDLLAKRLRKVAKSADGLGGQRPADWQKLWKRVQILRYALDFVRTVGLPGHTGALLPPVEELRRVLKQAVDTDEAITLLSPLEAGGHKALRLEVGPVLTELERRRAQALAALPAAWGAVEEAARG